MNRDDLAQLRLDRQASAAQSTQWVWAVAVALCVGGLLALLPELLPVLECAAKLLGQPDLGRLCAPDEWPALSAAHATGAIGVWVSLSLFRDGRLIRRYFSRPVQSAIDLQHSVAGIVRASLAFRLSIGLILTLVLFGLAQLPQWVSDPLFTSRPWVHDHFRPLVLGLTLGFVLLCVAVQSGRAFTAVRAREKTVPIGGRDHIPFTPDTNTALLPGARHGSGRLPTRHQDAPGPGASDSSASAALKCERSAASNDRSSRMKAL